MTSLALLVFSRSPTPILEPELETKEACADCTLKGLHCSFLDLHTPDTTTCDACLMNGRRCEQGPQHISKLNVTLQPSPQNGSLQNAAPPTPAPTPILGTPNQDQHHQSHNPTPVVTSSQSIPPFTINLRRDTTLRDGKEKLTHYHRRLSRLDRRKLIQLPTSLEGGWYMRFYQSIRTALRSNLIEILGDCVRTTSIHLVEGSDRYVLLIQVWEGEVERRWEQLARRIQGKFFRRAVFEGRKGDHDVAVRFWPYGPREKKRVRDRSVRNVPRNARPAAAPHALPHAVNASVGPLNGHTYNPPVAVMVTPDPDNPNANHRTSPVQATPTLRSDFPYIDLAPGPPNVHLNFRRTPTFQPTRFGALVPVPRPQRGRRNEYEWPVEQWPMMYRVPRIDWSPVDLVSAAEDYDALANTAEYALAALEASAREGEGQQAPGSDRCVTNSVSPASEEGGRVGEGNGGEDGRDSGEEIAEGGKRLGDEGDEETGARILDLGEFVHMEML